jgi:hypothetical protein
MKINPLVNQLRVWVGLPALPLGRGRFCHSLAPGETSIQSAAIAAARCEGAEKFRRSMGRRDG